MSNTQLYISVGVPTFAILCTLVANLFLISGVRDAVKDLRTDTNTRLMVIEGDLRQFFQITGNHGKAIEILEKKR